MLAKRKLSLLVPNLLSRDGKELVTGGLERYVWPLLDLARQMAFNVDVHQYGDSDWQEEAAGIKIKGYGLAALSPEADNPQWVGCPPRWKDCWPILMLCSVSRNGHGRPPLHFLYKSGNSAGQKYCKKYMADY